MTKRNALNNRHIEIHGKTIFLRPLTPEHATEEYASWINDPEVNKYLDTRSATIPELQEFIGRYTENENALLLGIFWKENGEHIGNVKLEPIAWETGEAELGIMIGNKTYWGRGAATEATNLVTRYAFDDLGLRAVTLGVVPGHKAALRVYEKCGFTIDRIEKDAVHHDGTPPGRIVMRKTAPPPPAV